MKKNLEALKQNESAILDSIDINGLSPEQVNTFMDYGFLPGSKIDVIYKYPSQSKMIVRLGTHDIAVRLEDAKHILVN